MAIRLLTEEGTTRVVAVCDTCDEVITDGAMALYVWDPVDEDNGRFWTVHKGACDRTMPGSDVIGGKRYSLELDLLPVYLGRGLGLDSPEKWARAQETAGHLGSF